MNDLNFFYGFVQEKRNKTRSITLLLVSILLVLDGAVSSVLYLERYISGEKVNIDKRSKILRSTNGIKLESNFQRISEEERGLKESLTQIQNIKVYVSGLNKITTQGILRVFNALPKNVSINYFECNKGELSMECESFDRKGVASTINNFKRVDLKDVHVPTIVAVDNEGVTTYGFHISAKLQEGENHEDD